MKTETLLLVLGAAAVAGGGYYFLVYKPKQLAASTPAAQPAALPPTVPSGSIPTLGTTPVPAPAPAPSPAPPGAPAWPTSFYSSAIIPPAILTSLSSAPTGTPKQVSLTTAFPAYDITTGVTRTFQPGDQVWIYTNPDGTISTIGGWSSLADVESGSTHVFATQSAVAGNLVGAPRSRAPRMAVKGGHPQSRSMGAVSPARVTNIAPSPMQQGASRSIMASDGGIFAFPGGARGISG